jgi:Clp amino terminal domain, pathogenicity island component
VLAGRCQTGPVNDAGSAARDALLRRGFALEYATLAWNVAGIVVLAFAAAAARSVALAGFGLDSLIEIGASTVVIWELSGTGAQRQRRGLRLIGCAFGALAGYLFVQSTVVLVSGYHPRHSAPGIVWTALTAAAMFALAAGKARAGRALGNPVLRTEGRVTMIDGILAISVLAGLALNAGLGWWWADPLAGTCWSATRPARSTNLLWPAGQASADPDSAAGLLAGAASHSVGAQAARQQIQRCPGRSRPAPGSGLERGSDQSPPARPHQSVAQAHPGIHTRATGFLPFSAPARDSTGFAWREARRLGSGHWDPRHLLLGLLNQDDGIAARALERLGINRTEVRQRIGQLNRRGVAAGRCSAASPPAPGRDTHGRGSGTL